MSETLNRATQTMTAADLPRMVLGRQALPATLSDFIPSRVEYLDNETMAKQGFPWSSAERFRSMGRITGYLQEFLAPEPEEQTIPDGYNLAAATVVHLFDSPEGVSRWIKEVFLAEFEARVDEELHPGQLLLMAKRLQFEKFADETGGLQVLQSSPQGPISSTVVDFRIGRLLGVAYVATSGNCERQELVQRLGRTLERNIVNVVLEARPMAAAPR